MTTASYPRVGVVGVSIDDPCGVRDHATLLASALASEELVCSLHWLRRTEASLSAETAEIDQVGSLARRASSSATTPTLSCFITRCSHCRIAAFPFMSDRSCTRCVSLHVPLVSFMHEFAYPWSLGAMRAKVWAATQRVALIDAMRASAGIVVSADDRADWLRTRPWLPRRAISVAPVFSNLPPASQRAVRGDTERIGLFGYAHEGVAVETVVEALRVLHEGGRAPKLLLLGAPGRDSPAAERWLQVAARNGVAEALRFSGRLPAQQLSDELAGCAVLLFAERGGPTARKTTLAASLSSGRPVVVLDGPNSWTQLRQARATVAAQPAARPLADALARLLDDAGEQERQGQLGRSFAQSTMSIGQSAKVVGGALTRVIAQTPR